MDTRVIALLLAAGLAVGCDTTKRETGSTEGPASAPLAIDSDLQSQKPRTGTVQIGDQRLHFDVGVCSIQQPTSMNRFMLTGRGSTADGGRFTVNADGGAEVAAIVIRIADRHNNHLHTYSARIEPARVRIDDRAISAMGEFGRLGEPRTSGQFVAQCGAKTPGTQT